MTAPRATYRVQLQLGFDFAAAAELVAYLAQLGVSHLYVSPITQAVPGSTHGYDVVDSTRPSQELGGEDGLAALHDAGITLADVDEAMVGYIAPTSMIGIKAMKELGLTGLPVTHIENASATGLVAFREAAWAVSSGRERVRVLESPEPESPASIDVAPLAHDCRPIPIRVRAGRRCPARARQRGRALRR